jgi:hypothetical protein
MFLGLSNIPNSVQVSAALTHAPKYGILVLQQIERGIALGNLSEIHHDNLTRKYNAMM